MTKMHNDGQHVVYICNKTECSKHNADIGTPCWSVYQSETGRYLPALCGSRIRKAGFAGVITALSLNKKQPGRDRPGVVKRFNESRSFR